MKLYTLLLLLSIQLSYISDAQIAKTNVSSINSIPFTSTSGVINTDDRTDKTRSSQGKELEKSQSVDTTLLDLKLNKKQQKIIPILTELSKGRNSRLAGDALAQLAFIYTFHPTYHNFMKAIQYVTRSVQMGSARGMHIHAFYIKHGLGGIKINETAALEFEKLAAESNYLQAQMSLGFHYFIEMKNKTSVPVSEVYCSLSLSYYHAAAITTIETIRREYRDDYLSITPVDELDRLSDMVPSKRARDEETIAYYKFEAERKDPQSLHELGVIYQHGLYGENRDMKLAISFFEKASSLSFVRSLSELGRLLILGHGVDVDISRGLNYLRTAAEEGDTSAMTTLAILIRRGLFSSNESMLHVKYLQEAASKGISEAEYELGLDELFEGSVESAIQRFRRAEAMGHIKAMFTLGNMYQSGVSVTKSCERAVIYFKRVCESGYWNDEGVKETRRIYTPGKEYTAYLHALFAASEGYAAGLYNSAWLLMRNKVNNQPSSGKFDLALSNLIRLNMYASDKNSLLLTADIYRSRSFKYRNSTLALQYYNLAIQEGSAVAMRKAAVIYQNGAGVSSDEDRALVLLRRASTGLFQEIRGIRLIAAEIEIIFRIIQISIFKVIKNAVTGSWLLNMRINRNLHN